MRRLGVEMLVWSSRLLLPAALAVHLWLVWSVAPRGLLACLATLLAPGVAEVGWVAVLGWRSAPGQVVLIGGAAIVVLILLLGLGMAAMAAATPRRAVPPRPPGPG